MSISRVSQCSTKGRGNWCWLACAVSGAAYYGANQFRRDARLANKVLGQDSCCADGSTDVCNRLFYINDGLAGAGCTFAYRPNALDPPDLMNALNGGDPVIARIGWNGGSPQDGHFCVVIGADSATEQVHVVDPAFPECHALYTAFRDNYQGVGGVWTDSFVLTGLVTGAVGAMPLMVGPEESFSQAYTLGDRARSAAVKRTAEVYTLSLEAAARPNALLAIAKAGNEEISEMGIRAIADDGTVLALCITADAATYARSIASAMQPLRNECILKIPASSSPP